MRVHLEHILEAIQRVAACSQGGWEAFSGNQMAQDAVIHNVEIIGEATKPLGEATKAKHPEMPWRDIAGFRDVLIHDYMWGPPALPGTLFAAEEAYAGACTAKTMIYCANIAAGMVLSVFTRWLRGLPVEPDVSLNLLAAEISTPGV